MFGGQSLVTGEAKRPSRPGPRGQNRNCESKGPKTTHVIQNVQKLFPFHKGKGQAGKFLLSKGLAGY
jgi:hypothetical protein